jgi:hypothetical protein
MYVDDLHDATAYISAHQLPSKDDPSAHRSFLPFRNALHHLVLRRFTSACERFQYRRVER